VTRISNLSGSGLLDERGFDQELATVDLCVDFVIA
jgi:hypothetical protein